MDKKLVERALSAGWSVDKIKRTRVIDLERAFSQPVPKPDDQHDLQNDLPCFPPSAAPPTPPSPPFVRSDSPTPMFQSHPRLTVRQHVEVTTDSLGNDIVETIETMYRSREKVKSISNFIDVQLDASEVEERLLLTKLMNIEESTVMTGMEKLKRLEQEVQGSIQKKETIVRMLEENNFNLAREKSFDRILGKLEKLRGYLHAIQQIKNN